MKNLGKTIDRILKVEPSLEPQLIPIKTKWERFPNKKTQYWEQFLKVLNTELTPQHPKRAEIQDILTVKSRKITRYMYTFEAPTQIERVLGPIPEYLEGRLRKYDRRQLEIAKLGVEARLTHNNDLLVELTRRSEILEVKQKQVWTELKDHFKLWNTDGPITFLVRKKDGMLVLTAVTPPAPAQAPPPGIGSNEVPESFLMRLDPETLRRFFRFFNINPPPGMFPE